MHEVTPFGEVVADATQLCGHPVRVVHDDDAGERAGAVGNGGVSGMHATS
nr:hypothetical protein [Promicromonospora umidemergens]